MTAPWCFFVVVLFWGWGSLKGEKHVCFLLPRGILRKDMDLQASKFSLGSRSQGYSKRGKQTRKNNTKFTRK
jgi:hypothetical protein